MPPEATAIIASVDEKLRDMLQSEGRGEQTYLSKGRLYNTLPTKHNLQNGATASRHDHLIAHLCSVGVRSVTRSRELMQERKFDLKQRSGTASKSGRAQLPRAAAQRGVKRVICNSSAISKQPDDSDLDEDQQEWDEQAWLSAGWQVLNGVPGHYFKGSASNARNHSVALILGRLYAFCAIAGIPDTVAQGLLVRFRLAGINVGQMHHSRSSISAYSGILSRFCLQGCRNLFWQRPKNLLFPSAWRLVFDGVTLANGITVTIVLVIFTSHQGEFVVHFLGCARGGWSSTGEHTASGILKVLDDALGLSQSYSACKGSQGLPLTASQGSPCEARRGMFLTSMPCDRAYCGETGNKADLKLCEKLGVTGLAGITRRVGMADLFHCYDGCATALFKSVGAEDAGDGEESISDISSEDEDDPLSSWVKTCRHMQAVFGRGHGNYHLKNAYEHYGIPGRPKIMTPCKTRMIVYSSEFLRQSFAHFPARYLALKTYWQSLKDLSEDKADKKQRQRYKKRMGKIARLGARLTATSLLSPFLIHMCLKLPGGFVAGALQVQTTAEVFFPLHMVRSLFFLILRSKRFISKIKPA